MNKNQKRSTKRTSRRARNTNIISLLKFRSSSAFYSSSCTSIHMMMMTTKGGIFPYNILIFHSSISITRELKGWMDLIILKKSLPNCLDKFSNFLLFWKAWWHSCSHYVMIVTYLLLLRARQLLLLFPSSGDKLTQKTTSDTHQTTLGKLFPQNSCT